jgi:hypothetical protein
MELSGLCHDARRFPVRFPGVRLNHEVPEIHEGLITDD